MSASGSPPFVQSNLAKTKKTLIKERLSATEGANGDAAAEAKALAHGDLEEQARQNHHARKEKAKEHFAHAMVWAVWIGFGLGAIVVLVWLLHSILPAKCLWLNEIQLETLKQIIHVCAASMGGYLFNSFKHYVDG